MVRRLLGSSSAEKLRPRLTVHAGRIGSFRLRRCRSVSRRIGAAVFFLLSIRGALAGEAEAESRYEKLLARVKALDRTVDFQELRLAFTETPDYNPYGGDREAHDALYRAFDEKEYQEAVKLAEAVLAKKYVDLDAQFVCYVAHRRLGNKNKAAFHKLVLDGLVGSILDSGDGTSPATACVVIEIREEYFILEVLGCRLKTQALTRHEGQMIDRMDVVDKEGQDRTLYFNINRAFAWLQKTLGKVTEEE